MVSSASSFYLIFICHNSHGNHSFYMIPVAIAPVIEHVGDIYVVSAVAGKDFTASPGLHRTMLGDGLACLLPLFLVVPQ